MLIGALIGRILQWLPDQSASLSIGTLFRYWCGRGGDGHLRETVLVTTGMTGISPKGVLQSTPWRGAIKNRRKISVARHSSFV